jgi:hypothetical protein
MTDPTAPAPSRNEAAETLRRMVNRLADAAGPAWTPADSDAVIDAALAEERRLVVQRIRGQLSTFHPASQKVFGAILDEVEADR